MAEWPFIDGLAVSMNIELLDLPLARFTNFIWWLMIREANQTERDKMRAKLWRPPLGEAPDKRSPWSAEAEKGAFEALKAGFSAKTS